MGRREAAQEAAKRNKEKMEECKKKVCKTDCQPDDKSVGCKYCVLKTCLKRAPKAGTCAKNKCIDVFNSQRAWISGMYQNCEKDEGKKEAGPLFARGFSSNNGSDDEKDNGKKKT